MKTALPEAQPIPNLTFIPSISKLLPPMLWIFFVGSLALIGVYYQQNTRWIVQEIFRINGLSLVIFATVGFFGALISTYAKNYLAGFKYQHLFSWYSLGFIISVLLFVVSNHVLLLVIGWFFMGWCMAQLIGIQLDWPEAQQASRYALKFYTASSVLLASSVGLLSYHTDSWLLTEIMTSLANLPKTLVLVAALLLILAGLIQSALFPFHRWLLSAMTAPTPASALMHAGFINSAGILFTLFASLLVVSNTLTLLFVVGGFTAMVAQFLKLLQVNVKHKLACSTIAQMGFMVMQCGLGFFNAAIAHLILHGFYKAYLFLSSGEEIKMSTPHPLPKLKIQLVQAIFVLVFGVAGAWLFMLFTGKTSLGNTGVFLTIIVAITVGQATYNIIKEQSYSFVQRIVISTVLFSAGIGMYALAYNGVSLVMAEMSYVANPQKLTYLEISFGVLFLVGFFLMKLGVYKKTPWLYVKLLNLTQPHAQTLFKSKS